MWVCGYVGVWVCGYVGSYTVHSPHSSRPQTIKNGNLIQCNAQDTWISIAIVKIRITITFVQNICIRQMGCAQSRSSYPCINTAHRDIETLKSDFRFVLFVKIIIRNN